MMQRRSRVLLPAAAGLWAVLIVGLRAVAQVWAVGPTAGRGAGIWALLPELGGRPVLFVQTALGYAPAVVLLALLAAFWPARTARAAGRRARLVPLAALIGVAAIDLAAALAPAPPAVLAHPRPAAGAPPPPDAPNLLLVTIDTLRADALGAYGAPRALTPCLDGLGRRGWTAACCLTPIPVTTPAHAALFTGALPALTGSRFNAEVLSGSLETLAEALGRAGYATAASVGAFPLRHDVSGLDRGFEHYIQYFCPRRFHPLWWATAPGRLVLAASGAARGERSARLGNAAVLTVAGRQPFFLWLHYYEPHLPYDPPRPLDRLTPAAAGADASVEMARALDEGRRRPDPAAVAAVRDRYHGEVADADRALAELLADLARRGLLERTVVAVAADHGESLGEHDYYFSHGRLLHDPSLRVPLLVAGPGVPRRLSDRPVGLHELGPVLLALTAGAAALDGSGPLRCPPSDGWHSLAGEPAGRLSEPLLAESGEGVFLESHRADPAMLATKRFAASTLTERVVRQPEGGLVYYDLAADPAELAPRPPPWPESALALAARVEAAAAAPAARPGHRPALDEEKRRQLESLGYLTGGAAP